MAKIPAAPIWNNPAIVLFHGTTQNHVASIQAGVNVAAGKPSCDFGRGFYTTTSVQQARRWARSMGVRHNQLPAVIRFAVDRDALAALNFLAFVRKDIHALDFWNLVRHCRLGYAHRPVNPTMYDVVVGPVAMRWKGALVAFRDYDQFSFHTNAAAALLDLSNPGVVP